VTDTPRLIDVALPLPMDDLFTYHLSRDLEGVVLPGMRVVVPFKRDRLTGVVVGFRDQVDFRTRPIIDAPDPEPAFDEGMLRLTRWVADYYLSSWGEALRAALPQGIGQKSRWIVRPVGVDPVDEAQRLSRQAPVQSKLLAYIAERGEVTLGNLRRLHGGGGFRAALRSLESDHHIEIVDIAPDIDPAIKMERTLNLSNGDDGEDTGLGPEQRRLMEALRSARGPVEERLVRKAWGISLDTIKRLEKRRCIVVEEREVVREPDIGPIDPEILHTLTPDQEVALGTINEHTDRREFSAILLQGVTGSGKTRVYLDAIERVLADGGGAIVLVPEISLTPQTTRRFKARFGDEVAVIHSQLSVGERYDAWRQLHAGTRRVAVGPRSAAFAPVRDLRLIVVDEEHDGSYKQDEPDPRYHARDVAVVRAQQSGATVVLGTATPSFESLENARRGKYTLVSMPNRIDSRPMPKVHVVDMRRERDVNNWSSMSHMLRGEIRDRLVKKEQVVILQNRRGFSPVVQCNTCGKAVECRDCKVTLNYHRADERLKCHYCGDIQRVPEACPSCGVPGLKFGGSGTQKVQDEILKSFPDSPLIRMDQDTTRQKGAHHQLLEQFRHGQASILLGTQMVSKGLDFPDVTLVGVISADIGLGMPDFRAAERTFQLLTQVAGRTGRGTQPGEVIVQTYQPDHPAILAAQNHDVAAFAETELEERRMLGYPPFARLVLCQLKGTDQNRVRDAAARLGAIARQLSPESMEILGPTEAPIERIAKNWRWQILLKGQNGATLRKVAKEMSNRYERLPFAKKVRLAIDIDPMALL
jgi:primosomal protein N' (replication factor Y) (superfamily II helicase)